VFRCVFATLSPRSEPGFSATLLGQDLSLRFKHKSFVMDIKPLAKLPLCLFS
jgi:hypothetical protein